LEYRDFLVKRRDWEIGEVWSGGGCGYEGLSKEEIKVAWW